MTMTPQQLIDLALAVATRSEFEALTRALDDAGAPYERPVGDLLGNLSAISASGDPEHLVLELVTNGQDALLERRAAALRLAGEVVPRGPRELAQLLGWPGETKTNQALAQQLQLSLRDSGERNRPTLSLRDRGIGVDAARARKTIFSLINAPKNHASYLLGNYGKGGSTMYRDGRGAVLIGRPSPELIAETGCEDRVWLTVVDAVHDFGKVDRWTYRVTSEFDADRPADTAPLLSFPSSEVNFDPGLLVTHISYAAPGMGKASILRDRKSIYVLGNTRIFDPVLPWSIVDDRSDKAHTGYRVMYGSRSNFIGGEQRQLKGSPLNGVLLVSDPEGGEAYDLPITAFLFDPSSRSAATSPDHVVVFTSNGQVQAHWGAVETRNRTAEAGGTISGLRRVAQNVMFVEVDLDRVPSRVRSRVVSADRTRFTDIPVAKTIELETARWLTEQPVLLELEKELSLDRSRSTGRAQVSSKTLDEIARKLGFRGSGGTRLRKSSPPKPPQVLLAEPTELSGHGVVSVVLGKTKTIHFSLNAVDDFLARMVAEVELDIEGLLLPAKPAASSLRGGRFSMELLVGSEAEPAEHSAVARIRFMARSGGLKTLTWPFKLVLLKEPRPLVDPPGKKKSGPRPVVRWVELESSRVGDVSDQFTGAELAEVFEESDYAQYGDERLTLIEVNRNYLTFRQYLDEVAASAGDRTVEVREGRYVVGVAVALSRVFGVIPGAADDPFPSVENGERQELARLAADAVVASLQPVQEK